MERKFADDSFFFRTCLEKVFLQQEAGVSLLLGTIVGEILTLFCKNCPLSTQIMNPLIHSSCKGTLCPILGAKFVFCWKPHLTVWQYRC